MSVRTDCYGATTAPFADGGCQDQYLIADLSRSLRVHYSSLDIDRSDRLNGSSCGLLLLVADGAGDDGVRAATAATDGVVQYFLTEFETRAEPDSQGQTSLTSAVDAAFRSGQATLKAVSEGNSTTSGNTMSAAMSMAYISWPHVFAVSQGGCRAYLQRGGALTPLDDGNQQVETQALQPGDKVLLCTDGLREFANEHELNQVLARPGSAETHCESLLRLVDKSAEVDATAVVAQFLHNDAQLRKAESQTVVHPHTEEAVRGPSRSIVADQTESEDPEPIA